MPKESQDPDTVAVLTARSPQRIVREGGSQAWKLDPVRAKSCTYLVCAQNKHHADLDFSDATQPHGTGFLVGRISRLSPAADAPDRWMIEVDRYALIDRPQLWKGWRNPVRYTSLAELGIELDELTFEAMPAREHAASSSPDTAPAVGGITIAQAKTQLAATYGVQPESIEIVIRG